MNILVTGANGFVGVPLCRLLARTGVRVRGAVRAAAGGGDFEPIVIGDIGPDTAWDAALKDIDVVVHLAARVHIMRDSAPDPLAAFRAVNVHGTVRLAEAAREAGVKRFVFLSSAKVHGEASAEHPFDEQHPPQPCGPYAVSKWEAEQALAGIAGSDMALVVLRPPLVYGPHVRGNFLALLRAVERRWPLPLGAIANRRSLLFVDNLVDAIARSVSHAAAAGRTFLVSDGEDLSTPELVRAIAAGLGVEPRLIHVPQALLLWGGTMIGRRAAVERLIGSLQVDSRRIRSELDWMPPYSAAQGLEATARWYRQAGDSAAL